MSPLNVREPTTTYIYDDLGRLSRGLMMKRVELDFLKRHLASTIIKARVARVGWVERSETHQRMGDKMGFGYRLYPSYNYNDEGGETAR